MVRGLVGGWRMFVVLAFLAACLLRFSKKLSAKNRDTIWPSCPDFEFHEDFACGIRIKFQELQRGQNCFTIRDEHWAGSDEFGLKTAHPKKTKETKVAPTFDRLSQRFGRVAGLTNNVLGNWVGSDYNSAT